MIVSTKSGPHYLNLLWLNLYPMADLEWHPRTISFAYSWHQCIYQALALIKSSHCCDLIYLPTGQTMIHHFSFTISDPSHISMHPQVWICLLFILPLWFKHFGSLLLIPFEPLYYLHSAHACPHCTVNSKFSILTRKKHTSHQCSHKQPVLLVRMHIIL